MPKEATVFWEPECTGLRLGLNTTNVMTNGREEQDTSRRTGETISFTQHGIVYSFSEPHDESAYSSDKEFSYYAMVHKGHLWRGKSWGGAKSPKGSTHRAQRFASNVVLAAAEMEGIPLPITDDELLKRNKNLADALDDLADLVLSWMNGIMARIGISWSSEEDYPPALKRALHMIGGGDKGS